MRCIERHCLGLLALLLAGSCAAPRIAGTATDVSYGAPSSHWSVDLPFDASVCQVLDEQYPAQENAHFSPKLPLGLATYQVAVTHRAPTGGERGLVEEAAWFEEILDGLNEPGGPAPRLLAASYPASPARERWMRIIELNGRGHFFLLRPLPPLSPGGSRGAVLFSLTAILPATRNRIGDDPPLALPLSTNWARLVSWSESFVWHGPRPTGP